ncbi:MAG: B12-binding domain-containing radical SAM protein [Candidatus Omnitrophica bacterium]|nr:B12-binding domain-containing radical SAM protein [Candidatus Omnitrophota bacterium]MBU2251150.1 B12-binding domain-containing radical SAM protein [Candidatus Omnitrophota bacterium]
MKYNHALFLNPYVEKSATSAMMLFPPTGLEYIAASAKDCVEKVTLMDLRYEKDLLESDKLLDFIRREIDVVCVGVGWDRQFEEICGLLNKMPPDLPLILGGYTATEKIEEFFKACSRIDIIVRGEGEASIKEILNGVPAESILGISYRVNGKINHNQNRPLSDVSLIPSPDRKLRRNEYRYTLNGARVANFTFDTILSSRGCPYNCKFCTFTLNPLGQKRTYSARSAESVVEEIKTISAEVILFSDEDLSINPKRVEKICDLIIAAKIKKRFAAQVRVDIARYPVLLEKMVKAGFKALLIGIESPQDRILAQLNKGFDSAAVRRYFKVLKKYPMHYHGYFIYGNISETEEEMLYIPEFAKEIGVDSITFLKLRIEKFSPLREIAENAPGYHIGSNGVLYSDEYSYDKLKKIGKRIKFSFYTPMRFVKILKKSISIRLLTFKDLMFFLFNLPLLLKHIFAREIQRGRLKDSLKRTFFNNN